MKDSAKHALIAVLAVALAAIVVIGLYLGYWWLREDTTDRQVGVTNRNTGTQTAWADEATDLINQAALIEGTPQAQSLERQACVLIGRLTDPYLSDDLVAFQSRECL